MKVFVGDDWAEAHHDVHLMNGTGDKLTAKRLPEGLDGIAAFHALVAEHADDPSKVIIGIETETSPRTIASGTKRAVLARQVRNRRIYDAIDQWAFCSITTSPGCRQFYDQQRAAGDLHHQALRALGNRLVGYLHGCLRTRRPYNEHTAWAHRPTPGLTIAA